MHCLNGRPAAYKRRNIPISTVVRQLLSYSTHIDCSPILHVIWSLFGLTIEDPSICYHHGGTADLSLECSLGEEESPLADPYPCRALAIS